MDLLGCKVVFLGLVPAWAYAAWTAPWVEHREPAAGGEWGGSGQRLSAGKG